MGTAIRQTKSRTIKNLNQSYITFSYYIALKTINQKQKKSIYPNATKLIYEIYLTKCRQ